MDTLSNNPEQNGKKMRSNDLRCKSYQPIQANTMKGPIFGYHPMGNRQRPYQNITLSNKINAKAALFRAAYNPAFVLGGIG